jgi:O-antigen ligase
MSIRAWWRAALAVGALTLALGALTLALVALSHAPVAVTDRAASLYVPVVGALAFVSLAIVVWHTHPAYTLSAAILLTPFAGNWPQLGVPGPLSPDRLLLAGGIVAVLLRAPQVADRPRLRISPAHWLLAMATAYAVGSAFLAGTLFHRDPFFKIVDAFGILPFLTFLVAPLAFATPRHRRVLLVTMVALGAYLGLTTLFETARLDALVFPRYILDPSYGIHAGRGRGPFVDAVANGLALYTCAAVCAVAAATWRGRAHRTVAVAVGLLCLVGAFMSLQRSVWLAAGVATLVAMLAARRARRYLVPVLAATAVGIGICVAVIPALAERITQRTEQSETLWDRENLARAAVRMIEARPLFGFGWSRFTADSFDYFEQAPGYPLTATGSPVHNTPLGYGAELGLIGLTLWLLGLICGVGSALATRGPPDLAPWRAALLAVALAFLIVVSAVPPTAWPNRSLWLLAAVAYSGRYARWPNRRPGE